MFHEYREIVSELKIHNMHFKKIFDEHNDLHDDIEKAEQKGTSQIQLENMKKKKLKLKDEAYAMIIDFKNK